MTSTVRKHLSVMVALSAARDSMPALQTAFGDHTLGSGLASNEERGSYGPQSGTPDNRAVPSSGTPGP